MTPLLVVALFQGSLTISASLSDGSMRLKMPPTPLLNFVTFG